MHNEPIKPIWSQNALLLHTNSFYKVLLTALPIANKDLFHPPTSSKLITDESCHESTNPIPIRRFFSDICVHDRCNLKIVKTVFCPKKTSKKLDTVLVLPL